ncbi:hypothetical protein DTO027B5_885 [Paecilomyces variotii]|nr:hypothetical protein DTO169C6_327 [Paecilomyces variotii]KAJ9329713.1 hypothetical protein DTO027B3_200 [Paecilomyces variotii]KAJ9337536.1 hypothetical protein DTO027B5_885 [Paecilomyces variotii]
MVALQVITFAAVLEVLLIAKGALSSYLPDMTRKTSLASMIILVFAVNYTVWMIYRLIIYPVFVDPLRSFPGPSSVNGLKLLWFRLTTTVIPAERYVSVAKRYPNDSVVALRGLGKTQLLLTKPDPIAEVLTHHPYDFIKPPVIRKFLGLILVENGLVLAEGERHKCIRKNTRPAFSSRALQDLYPMMWTKALTLTRLLRDEVQQQSTAVDSMGTVDICPWATRVSLDIIGVAGLGREFNMLKNSEDQLFRAYEYLSEPTLEKIVYFFLCSRFSYELVQRLPFWRLNVAFREQIDSIRRIAEDLVREKREAIVGKGDDNVDILSLLIRSDSFSDAELVDQLLTYLVAGHETTSSAFTWACYLLAIHPNLQTTLRAEIRHALSSHFNSSSSVPIKHKDLGSILESLPILHGVLEEALRLYPAAPILLRVAAVDTHLCGRPIPKGTWILIPPWLINRSPEFWGADASDFRPDRWISPDGKRPISNAGTAAGNSGSLTFLRGPRSCIGQNFSRAELRCLIAAMVGQFEWTLAMPEDRVVPSGAVTIKPANGLYVKLKSIGPE